MQRADDTFESETAGTVLRMTDTPVNLTSRGPDETVLPEPERALIERIGSA